MMKRVDGRISVVRAAESVSIPQTSNHVFDFRKRSASAHTTISTYGFKIMVSGFQLPVFFASGLQLGPGGRPERIAEISPSYVTPLWGLLRRTWGYGKARSTWLYGTYPTRYFTSADVVNTNFRLHHIAAVDACYLEEKAILGCIEA